MEKHLKNVFRKEIDQCLERIISYLFLYYIPSCSTAFPFCPCSSNCVSFILKIHDGKVVAAHE